MSCPAEFAHLIQFARFQPWPGIADDNLNHDHSSRRRVTATDATKRSLGLRGPRTRSSPRCGTPSRSDTRETFAVSIGTSMAHKRSYRVRARPILRSPGGLPPRDRRCAPCAAPSKPLRICPHVVEEPLEVAEWVVDPCRASFRVTWNRCGRSAPTAPRWSGSPSRRCAARERSCPSSTS